MRRPSAQDSIGLGAPSSGGSLPHRQSGEMARLPSAASEYITSPVNQRRPSEASTRTKPSFDAQSRPSFDAPGRQSLDAPSRPSFESSTIPETPRATDTRFAQNRSEEAQATPRAIPAIAVPPEFKIPETRLNGSDGSTTNSASQQRLELPKITTTAAPATSDNAGLKPTSATASANTPTDRQRPRRDTYYPAPIDTAFSREVLLTSRTGLLPGAAGLTLESDQDAAEDALLDNVEQQLEGFDWTATVSVSGGLKKGSADATESRLLEELAALDSANIHAFLESDDRIAQVLGHIDEAINELDDLDMQITGYKMQLNAVADDISFIESQNRGLQVQTSNQHALLRELQQLLQIVEVPRDDLAVLSQETPGNQRGIEKLERAATSLYKALLAGMDQANAEVSATIARMQEYKETSAQFSKRMLDFLDVQFRHQSDQTLARSRQAGGQALELEPHNEMCEALMSYEGLVLYIKEMEEDRYQRLCSVGLVQSTSSASC